MKHNILLVITILFFGNVTTLAQSLKNKDFQLQKATHNNPPTSALKDIRSIPSAPKSVLNSPLRNFKTNLSLQQPIKNQRFLKIKKDQATGLPVWISGKLENAATQRTASLEVRVSNYLDAVKEPLQIENPSEEFFIKKINTDQLGHNHIKMQQRFQGLTIYGSEIIVHEKEGDIYLVNGRHYPTPILEDIIPTINLQNAKQVAQIDITSFSVFKNLTDEEKKYVAGEQFQSELVIYHPKQNITTDQVDIKNPKLAYHLTVIPNLTERWEYLIDAKSGEILNKYSSICKLHHHSHPMTSSHRITFHHKDHNKKNHEMTSNSSGEVESHGMTLKSSDDKKGHSSFVLNGPATANETDLLGINRTINTYEVDGTYFMYDGSRPMFDVNSDLPSDPKGMIVTVNGLGNYPNNNDFDYTVVFSDNNNWNNPSAVSAHYNGGEAYQYFKTTHGRESINGQGGTIISFFNISNEDGSDMDNAFWNGAAMFYGNGNQAFNAPLQRALDVAGHEMSHGVIQGTANLEYQNQSGALNESFADIFGAMIDRDDWQMGEDITNPAYIASGALRSLSNPNNGGSSLNSPGWQPKTMSEYQNLPNTPQGDNGGVHINSGIPNYAFFLFASDIGKDKAEQVYYRALDVYLVKSSQFVDLRNAVVQATQDLYGSAEVNAANAAFNAVGIGEGSGGNYQTDVVENAGDERILHSNEGLTALYLVDLNGMPVTINTELSLTNPKSKPSVTDNGREIVFVDDENNIKFINIDWTTGSIIEDYLELNPSAQWRNVAISKDGNRIAAVRTQAENIIWVYDYALGEWHQFDLYNPTTSDPNNGTVTTGDVQNAEAMEFDFTGEFLVYDAFNKLESSSGNSNLEYWDIGFLNVFDENAGTFGSGNIEKLFTGLPSGVSIGNPTFAKNSPYILAFDQKKEGFFQDTYSIIGVNIQTGDYSTIREAEIWSYPSFSIDDQFMIFDLPFQGSNILGKIQLNSDKITSVEGSLAALFPNGTVAEKWGVWLATGERELETTRTEEIELATLNGRVYPNPFSTNLTLELEHDQREIVPLRVFNIVGKEVLTTEMEILEGKNTIELSLQNLVHGNYFIQLGLEKGNVTTMIIKQ